MPDCHACVHFTHLFKHLFNTMICAVQKQVKLLSMVSALMSVGNLMLHQHFSAPWEFSGGQWGICTIRVGTLRNRKSLFCLMKGLAKVLGLGVFSKVTTVLNIGEAKSYWTPYCLFITWEKFLRWLTPAFNYWNSSGLFSGKTPL